ASVKAAEPIESRQEVELALSLDASGNLVHSPATLEWPGVGSVVKVNLDVLPPTVPVVLFVRDVQTIDWNAEKRELKAAAKGHTEIYVVSGKTMHIIPAAVKSDAATESLDVPLALTSLEGVFDDGASQALFAGVPSAISPDGKVAAETQEAIAKSVEETKNSLATQALDDQKKSRFGLVEDELAYGSLALQFTDDRSLPESGLIYPLDGMKVWVVGTEFVGETDATGHIVVPDVPANSRVVLSYHDKLDRVLQG